MENKDVQEKLLQYRVLTERLEKLVEQKSLFATRLAEIEVSKGTLEEVKNLKKGTEMLVAIGAMTYLNTELSTNEKVVVEIGAGVALEKKVEEAIKILEKREKTLREAIEKVSNEIEKTRNLMAVLEPQIQKILNQK